MDHPNQWGAFGWCLLIPEWTTWHLAIGKFCGTTIREISRITFNYRRRFRNQGDTIQPSETSRNTINGDKVSTKLPAGSYAML